MVGTSFILFKSFGWRATVIGILFFSVRFPLHIYMQIWWVKHDIDGIIIYSRNPLSSALRYESS